LTRARGHRASRTRSDAASSDSALADAVRTRGGGTASGCSHIVRNRVLAPHIACKDALLGTSHAKLCPRETSSLPSCAKWRPERLLSPERMPAWISGIQERLHEYSSRGGREGVRRPVLVVRVDVAGSEAADARAGRCDVRLVRSVPHPPNGPGPSSDQSWSSDGGEVTAVVILRDATPSRVVSCVRAATRGRGSISPELLCQLLPAGDDTPPEPSQPQLTEREYDVLRMLADGESTRGIAEQLSYSERTVKNIVHDLLAKLGCRTRAHAVALAARYGVI